MSKVTIFARTASALALLAGLGIAGSAQAAPWSGFYLGADLGYGWGNANDENCNFIGVTPSIFCQANTEIDGWQFNGHLGYNHMVSPKWLIGVEGNWGYSGIEGNDGGAGGAVNIHEANWDAALLAKVGVIVSPNAMLYIVGGWSWLDMDTSDTAPLETVSNTYSGYTLGVGAEFILGPQLTGRVQYRYTDYDTETVPLPVNGYYMEIGPSVNSVTVGLSWHF